uniref:Uncharacterized protein n=1 Tax=Daphnia magna TaxID=35525 RepID=A0A0P6HRA0_9CRUS
MAVVVIQYVLRLTTQSAPYMNNFFIFLSIFKLEQHPTRVVFSNRHIVRSRISTLLTGSALKPNQRRNGLSELFFRVFLCCVWEKSSSFF